MRTRRDDGGRGAHADGDDGDRSVDPGDGGGPVDPDDREFGGRGWLLVAATVVAFVVAPGIIYLYPHVGPMFGLTFWDTYLALPMVPAVVLGILAVWATTRP